MKPDGVWGEWARLVAAGRKPRTRSSLVEWTLTLIILLFTTTTIVEAYVIPTGSMDSTLLVGDHLLIDKLAYAKSRLGARYVLPYQEVRHGDIVVFIYPLDVRQNFVKRVIGMPGDRIRFEKRKLIRNGKPIDEPYRQHVTEFEDPYRDNFPANPPADLPARARRMLQAHVRDGELVVPEDQYFVMGDNRDNSLDSRYWGLVPREMIVGKPLLILWSYDAPTENLTEWRMEHFFDLATNFFTKTRWGRTGMIVRGCREDQ